MREMQTAVVLGELGLLRCLGEAGIPCVVVATEKEHLAFASRYCDEIVCVPSFNSDSAETLEILLDIGRRFPRSIIFCNGERDLLFVSRNRSALEQQFVLNLPPEHVLESLADKGLFAEFARQHQLPVPRTWLPSNARDLQAILNELRFPCIIKPRCYVDWEGDYFSRHYGEGTKAITVEKPRDLLELYHDISKVHPRMLIQEYVPGRDEQLYFVDAYFDANSRPLGYFVGHRIRSYPVHCGLSTLAQTVYDAELINLTLNILSRIQYRGAAHVDFKIDERDNQPRLLEINPRFGLTIDLGAKAGVNIPAIAYADLLDQSRQVVAFRPDYQAGLKWVDFKHDLKALVHYRQLGEWSVGEWWHSMRGPKTYRVWSAQDPMPFAVATARMLTTQSALLLRHAWNQRTEFLAGRVQRWLGYGYRNVGISQEPAYDAHVTGNADRTLAARIG